jgi:hypothetical protein
VWLVMGVGSSIFGFVCSSTPAAVADQCRHL